MLYKKKVDIWPLSLFMAKKLLKFGNLGAWNFLSAGNGKGVFCYANKVSGRAQWGLLLGKPVFWWEGWNFESHTLTSWGGEGSYRLKQLSAASDVISHAYITKYHKTPKGQGLENFLGWWTPEGAGRVVCFEAGGRGSPVPLPGALAVPDYSHM